MNSGFTKLFSSIVTSSLWVEPDPVLRVWVAMLALSDANGFVSGSIPGFASLCRISLEQMEQVELKLLSPDKHSRSKESEGRRITKAPGGWKLINYSKYREERNKEDRREYQRKWDRDNRPNRPNQAKRNNPRQPPTNPTQAEAEAEAEACTTNHLAPTLEQVKTRAAMTAMTEADAVAFWNHFEASGWIDKNGNPIVRWQSKMDTWKATARAAPLELSHHASTNGSKPKSAFELRAVIEAKNTMAAEIRTRYCSDAAMGHHWSDESKRVEYLVLKRDAKQLLKQLGNMA